jgi:GNAT superfamily N-acetyltransferase
LNQLEVRTAGLADAVIVGTLIARLLDELDEGTSHDAAEYADRAAALLRLADRVWGLLATLDSTPVGVLMLNECAAIYAGGIFGEITELYVEPACRSRGIGPALTEAAFAFARARRWKRLEVGAPPQPQWARTRQFYLREGFIEVGPRLRWLA